MSDELKLRLVQEEVGVHMTAILRRFKRPAKITVLVRAPGKPDRDFCMTNDDLAEVEAMVKRRAAAEQPKST